MIDDPRAPGTQRKAAGRGRLEVVALVVLLGLAVPALCRGAELVEPATRQPGRWGAARCNDGSPFGFYYRAARGSSSTWVVHLEGGGFCDDNAIACAGRSPSLTSSPPGRDGDRVDFPKETGIFATDPDENPLLHDAHHVFVGYCSSDGWMGETTVRRPSTGDTARGWFFSGRENVRATFETLRDIYALDDADPATRVLFTGSSAGGLGVLANAQSVAGLLPGVAARGRLALVVDGGWSHDFDHPEFRAGASGQPVREVLVDAYDFFGGRLDPGCEAAELAAGRHPGRCALGPVAYPFVVGRDLAVLVQQSSVDAFALRLHGIDPANPQHAPVLALWQETALSSLAAVERLFSGGFPPYHTILTAPSWSMGPEGRSFRDLVGQLVLDRPSTQVVFDRGSSAPCTIGEAVHCFHDGRFRVEVAWRDFQDRRGGGNSVPLASDRSGLFWFFHEENWELLIKVLDGCALTGRYWVFAAATTNVEYVLRVTDTRVGRTAIYLNPVGETAAAITDTGALPSCP